MYKICIIIALLYDHTVVSIPNIILATNANGSVPIYTVMFNERQAVQLVEEGKSSFNQPSIGEYICYVYISI